ncbi:MAG: hypothetical protein Q7S57_05840 [bacterium]|nr:hypothetical protein [bacterium]
MRDFSQLILRRDGKYHLRRTGGKWHLEYANDSSPHENFEPKDSLVELLTSSTFEMGFYHFSGQLYDFDLTINELYDENPRKTLEALCQMLIYMIEYFEQLKNKGTQNRDSIVRILKGPGDAIYPILRRLLENFLHAWETCPYEV